MAAKFITYANETLSIAEWSRRTGIPHETLRIRLDKVGKGWDIERALTQPVRDAGKGKPAYQPQNLSPSQRGERIYAILKSVYDEGVISEREMMIQYQAGLRCIAESWEGEE